MQYQVIKTYQYEQVVSIEAESEEDAIDKSMYIDISIEDVEQCLMWIEVQQEPDIWQYKVIEYN